MPSPDADGGTTFYYWKTTRSASTDGGSATHAKVTARGRMTTVNVAGRSWREHGTRLNVPPPVDFMEGFSGVAVQVMGVYRFTQYSQSMPVDALIVDSDTGDFLVGEDWMYDHGVNIVFVSSEMKWYENDVKKVVPFNGIGSERNIQTQTCHNAEVSVPDKDGTVGLFIPKKRKEPYLVVALTLVTVKSGKVKVPILNLVGKTAKLPSKEMLGTWTPLDDEMEVLRLGGDLERERVSEWLDQIRVQEKPLCNEETLDFGEMDGKDKELLVRLLKNYPELLAPKEGCPPATTLGVEHHINTGAASPIKIRLRRYSRVEQELVDAEVQKMLHDGVIEEGTGVWGFPAVLVRKKDGTVRFCIDYRLLNNVTKKDVYPLPRIDEALDTMHGSRRYSSLDFTQAIVSLANAPGTFQRMMDAVLRGLTWKSCLVYLDDVIIFTAGSVSRHVVELACVLERLSRAGLSLKPKKCSFAKTRLGHLGHELDEQGILPLESLVDTVKRFPTPENPDEFVPHFGAKAAPLTRLLRKSSSWDWGPEQQEASRPLLAYPDFTKPFKLVTDASVVGLDAALMQDQGAGDQPVAYASKVNSPIVAKYGITDLECAAVSWAVKLFRPYLYGRRFELVTDHSALSYLMKKKDLTGRPYRWSLQLQEFEFRIIYRPGSTNVVADALSRAPVRTMTANRRRNKQGKCRLATVVTPEGERTVGGNGQPTGGTKTSVPTKDATTGTTRTGTTPTGGHHAGEAADYTTE
ncbi:LOW QUALITY PROTEIN: hypothetical protein PHMEG_00028811 [Phytophthora megakarya]|uniref:Reverse transcriptase n=1 Tax=Phytophthora megakarya TaxID=4795 RepID=A0A225V6P0_9STRA|nr:LOW QUALITY PROTEIN: hypothetical protein PHMEG_00028811 [Phytophthora megakarya]